MVENLSWEPSASIVDLRARAQLLHSIRNFLISRGYWEVETPIMAQHGVSDVYLRNLTVVFREKNYCLQTSPEYHMKRLLAAGSGSIFQFARVFRDDELGRWHNPEFSLLEWYQLEVDHFTMMQEVDALLQLVLQTKPMICKTYQAIFAEVCDLDPFNTNLRELKACLSRFDLLGILPFDEKDFDQYLFLLMSHVIEPAIVHLESPVAIFHFPPSQASLARIHQGVAERFEVYFQGLELANGFHELTDADLQRKRFEEDNTLRRSKGIPTTLPDEYLLEALNHGLPNCSGVALGIDRLIALALKQPSIAKVMSFDISRS